MSEFSLLELLAWSLHNNARQNSRLVVFDTQGCAHAGDSRKSGPIYSRWQLPNRLDQGSKQVPEDILLQQAFVEDLKDVYGDNHLPFGHALRERLPVFIDLELPPRDGFTSEDGPF
jgi:hypothetical protein